MAALRAGQIPDEGIDAAERSLLEFARVLTLTPARVQDADVAALREAGWSDAQIAEAVYDISLFAFFNRVADAFGLQDPRDQYRTLLEQGANAAGGACAATRSDSSGTKEPLGG